MTKRLNRWIRDHRVRAGAALGGAAFVAASAFAVYASPPKQQPHAAQVTFLEGKAARTATGAATSSFLKVNDQLAQGDLVATEPKSRLELKLDDQSIIRLGPDAKLQLTEAQFAGGEEKRKLTIKLFFGNIWAKVASVVSGDQRFAVETENAVAGVRGTTFRVDAHSDKSVLVRVYAGAVAVAKPVPMYANPAGTLDHKQRKEVNGPEEVTRAQWEKLVGAQMQVAVSAKGEPGEPAPFTDADEAKDSWAKWNQERDGK